MADKKPFLTDVKTLRARARKHIEQGAVTESYRADRKTVIKLLNEALATEIICVLRYRRHHFMAAGINAEAVAAEFLVHAVRPDPEAPARLGAVTVDIDALVAAVHAPAGQPPPPDPGPVPW